MWRSWSRASRSIPRGSCARSAPTSWPASTGTLRPIWKRYCALVEETPAEPLHLSAPGGSRADRRQPHPRTCLVGAAEALVEQIRELERQGLQELMFAIGVDEKWRVAQAFAHGVIARM